MVDLTKINKGESSQSKQGMLTWVGYSKGNKGQHSYVHSRNIDDCNSLSQRDPLKPSGQSHVQELALSIPPF